MMKSIISCQKLQGQPQFLKNQPSVEYQVFYDKIIKTFNFKVGKKIYQFKTNTNDQINILDIPFSSYVYKLTIHHNFQIIAYQMNNYEIAFVNPKQKEYVIKIEGKEKNKILHFEWVYGTQRNIDFVTVDLQGVKVYKLEEDKMSLKSQKHYQLNLYYCWYEPINESLACASNNENGRIYTFFFNEKRQGFKYRGPDFRLDNVENMVIIDNPEFELPKKGLLSKASTLFNKEKINFQAEEELRNTDLITTLKKRNVFQNTNKLYLINIYNKTYLLFLNGYTGKIIIYSLQYEKITKPQFQLSVPSDGLISISVVDNLLMLHSHNEYMSMIYDIKRYNPIVPLGAPQPLQQNEELINQQQKTFVQKNLLDDTEEEVQVLQDKDIKDFSKHSLSQMYEQDYVFLQDSYIFDLKNHYIYELQSNVQMIKELVVDKIDVFQILLRRHNSKQEAIKYILNIAKQKGDIMIFSLIFRHIFEIIKRTYQDHQERSRNQINQQNQISQNGLQKHQEINYISQYERVSQQNKLNYDNEEKLQNGYTILYPIDVHNEFIQPLYEDKSIEREYLIAILSEYLRQSNEFQVKINKKTETQYVKLIIYSKNLIQLHFILQYGIISDSSELAKWLIDISDEDYLRRKKLLDKIEPYPPGFQNGIDMLYRLKKYMDIFQVFMKQGMFFEAMELIKKQNLYHQLDINCFTKFIPDIPGNMQPIQVYEFLTENMNKIKTEKSFKLDLNQLKVYIDKSQEQVNLL